MPEYGVVDIGPFRADISCVRGVWMFRPYYNHNAKTAEAVHMNAMIRDMGRIWTPVPEDEIPKLKKVLAARSPEKTNNG